MRVVLDTNVLFSALISPEGVPGAIYGAWRAGHFDLIASAEQIDEIRRASRYAKFRRILQPHLVGDMVNSLRKAILLDRLPEVEGATDPFDAFLLGMAVAGDADWLVTGDHRAGLLAMGSYGRCRIATPAGFVTAALA